MPEIKLVKRYPHIKDEDVTSIFQEGYIKGFENGRKGAIPIEWIEKYMDKVDVEDDGMVYLSPRGPFKKMLKEWEKENAKND